MKGRMIKAITVFSLLALLVPGTSSAGEDDPRIGKHLFRSYCAVCHGIDGKSVGALAQRMELQPADLTSEDYQKKSIDEMTKIISGYGRKDGSKMPTWSDALPEANIRHIAAYIAMLSMDDLRLTADIRRGRFIFKNSCTACHGPRGHGNGILAELIKAKMVDFANPMTMKTKTSGEITQVITEGKGDFMPAWHGTLSNDEILDVSAYVYSLRNHE